MSSKVTRQQAEKVIADIRTRYAVTADEEGPNLRDNTHEELRPGCWSIDWEDGPYEWAYDYAGEARNPGLLVEPINTFILGLYPSY